VVKYFTERRLINADFARKRLGRETAAPPLESEQGEDVTMTARARLLAKVYAIDVFSCQQCGGRMSVVAVIRDADEIDKVIARAGTRPGGCKVRQCGGTETGGRAGTPYRLPLGATL